MVTPKNLEANMIIKLYLYYYHVIQIYSPLSHTNNSCYRSYKYCHHFYLMIVLK